MFKRELEKQIKKYLFDGKAILVLGARRVGKTTLLEGIVDEKFSKKKVLRLTCDSIRDREKIVNDAEHIENFFGPYEVIFIDEAQKAEEIGNTVKILVDSYGKKKKILLSGSSTLNLRECFTESLLGRKFEFQLFPLSIPEADTDYKGFSKGDLEKFLIYGQYPEVLKERSFSKKEKILDEIISTYLFKDILEFQKVSKPEVVVKILRALALQVSNQVSISEIATLVGVDKNTVDNYITLLEQSFVIFKLPPYLTNKRNIISKMNKIYFYDLGVRNALISNFNKMNKRADVGQLWENLMILERLKTMRYSGKTFSHYFLRTYEKQELDLVEEREGRLFGFEFKYNEKKQSKVTLEKLLNVENSTTKTITPLNYSEIYKV